MDKNMIAGLEGMPEEDKIRMASMIDQLQIRDRCFTDCVDDFSRKSLKKQEDTCVQRCAEKFLKHSMRVGMRFAELNQGAATSDN
ncbi:Mitochondrial import inner membrane translocase subunit Tim9 [Linum perenne]